MLDMERVFHDGISDLDCAEDNVVRNQTTHQQGNLGLQELRSSIVGEDARYSGPYGEVQLLYADWAASGRAVSIIENYIQDEVLPWYANTHTTSSVMGLQSTCFRVEARQIIAQELNARIAKSDQHSDVILFTGTGSTGCVNHLVQCLGLHIPLPANTPENRIPVVFVGPFEHHSNLLPWRESAAEVVTIPEDSEGKICQRSLAAGLNRYASRTLKIGSFSAASNVTGVTSDVDAITEQLHRSGALAFWDYATAAPYQRVDMNPVVAAEGEGANPWVYKDAVFISLHKFAGGMGCPGLLVAKRKLFCNSVPTSPGGGTIFFVTDQDHRYLSNREEREEGGTQDLVGAVRAGLVFSLRAQIGVEAIARAECSVAAALYQRLQAMPRVRVLGPSVAPDQSPDAISRLAIASVAVEAPAVGGVSRFLHHNFVAAVLNDVFGIQTRGGCACAGPYALALLGIEEDAAYAVEEELVARQAEALRPGFVRVSLASHATEEEVGYVCDALALVALHGWRLLGAYAFNHKTGEWKHRSRMRSFPERRWLSHLSLRHSKPAPPRPQPSAGPPSAWSSQLARGRRVLETAGGEGGEFVAMQADEEACWGGHGAVASLRWFMLPTEAHALLHLQPTGCSALEFVPPLGRFVGAMDPGRKIRRRQPDFLSHSQSSVGTESVEDGAARRQDCPAAEPLGVPTEQEGNSEGLHNDDDQRDDAEMGLCWNGMCARQDESSARHDTTAGQQESDVAVASQNEPQSEEARAQTTEPSSHEEGERAAKADHSRVTSHKYPLRQACGPRGPGEGSGSVVDRIPLPVTAGDGKVSGKVMEMVAKAVHQWGMIEEGDRLLLGLSGGKDSLTLLHCLLHLQRRMPPGFFTLAAATVDPGTTAYNPRPLIPYMRGLGVEYHFLETNIMQAAGSGSLQGDSLCAFCARLKRGALYSCCRDQDKNVLVLGQHLDDLAESFLMAAMFNGRLSTMKAKYLVNNGDLRVIRPLIYTREKQTKDFAYSQGMPVIAENCPACYEAPKEREHIKKLLAREESLFPTLFRSIQNALVPLMSPECQDELNSIRTTLLTKNHRLANSNSKDAVAWRAKHQKSQQVSGRAFRQNKQQLTSTTSNGSTEEDGVGQDGQREDVDSVHISG